MTDIIKEFREKFDTPGENTYIGDLLQYENEKGDILFVIDDVEQFWLSKLSSQKKELLEKILKDIKANYCITAEEFEKYIK